MFTLKNGAKFLLLTRRGYTDSRRVEEGKNK